MLVVERQRGIVEIVDREGSIRVTELARNFQVTEETIRRDLEKLESEGKLERSHGGAVSVQNTDTEIPFTQREINHVREKILIAQEAVTRVKGGDTILLDASTTAWQMARLLPDMSLTVLTNAIQVALELANRPNVRVIMSGGMLLSSSLSLAGPLAERFLAEYHVDKLFLSCKGVDFHRGVSDANEWQATLKKRMLAIADESYLLVDHSKFKVNALSVFAHLHDFHEVITDDLIEDSLKDTLTQSGIGSITFSRQVTNFYT